MNIANCDPGADVTLQIKATSTSAWTTAFLINGQSIKIVS